MLPPHHYISLILDGGEVGQFEMKKHGTVVSEKLLTSLLGYDSLVIRGPGI